MPFVDFFNALPPSEEDMVKLEQNTTHLTFVSLKSIHPGTQILVTYGKYNAMANSQLLMDYGFVFQKNKGNTVFIPFQLQKSTDNYSDKLKLLKKAKLKREDNFQIRSSSEIPEALMMSYRISHLSSRELRRITQQDTIPAQISEQNESRARRSILLLADALLRGYRTTVEEDERLLQQELPLRQKMAVQVRMEEKALLIGLIEYLQAEIDNEYFQEKNIL